MKIRTNAQLIAELQKHDPEIQVVFHGPDGDCCPLGDIGIDGTCGDGSPGQPEVCLRISLAEDWDEEFESLTVQPSALESAEAELSTARAEVRGLRMALGKISTVGIYAEDGPGELPVTAGYLREIARTALSAQPAPAEPEKEYEWGVTYSYLYFHPGDRRNLKKPLTFQTEQEADDCIAGKMDCSPQMMREAEDIRKLKRTKAGEWRDVEAGS